MKIFNISTHSTMYNCNVYLVLGTWNAIQDVNTLIDVGRDPVIFSELEKINTGVGKRRVDQVILTHSHYDHASLLPEVKKNLNDPKVYAWTKFMPNIDEHLSDMMEVRCGDAIFQIYYAPGHTNDSICIYAPRERVIFCGDTHLVIQAPMGEYEEGYIRLLERLSRVDIQTIYPGHGHPITFNCNQKILNSWKIVRDAKK